jgi:predicted transglutaminase-like cysteine proteinase
MVALLAAVLWLACALPSWAAWDANRIRQSALKRGPQVATAAEELLNLLETLRPKPELERVRAVNDYFNRKIAFKDDRDVWAQADYWATPLEMFELGAGDCEDYALAKYFSLLSTGMSPAKLRLIYVRAQLGGPQGIVQAHMVLAYYPSPSAEPLVMDNLINRVQPASARTDLAPVFSFNSDGLWMGVGVDRVGDPVARLSRWADILNRARTEGFF